jgi:hypothetical protein
LRCLGLDIFTALAVVVVVFSLLNFAAGFALLFHVLRLSWLPAVAGALFFAFNNPKLSLPDNLQMQLVWPLATAAACIILFFRKVPSLTLSSAFLLLSLAGFALGLQLLTSFYLGWLLILWAGLFLGLSLCSKASRQLYASTLRLYLRPLCGAIAIVSPVYIAFLLIYLPALHTVPVWSYDPDAMHIPSSHSYLLMADGNFVWSHLTETLLQHFGQGPDWGRRVGLGAVMTITWLGLTGFALLGRIPEPFLVSTILSVNLLGLVALQYHGHSLWRVVYELAPGGKAVRDVARFMIVAALPISIAYAFTVHYLRRRIGQRAGLHLVLVGVIAFGAFEQFSRGNGDYFSISAENQYLEHLAAKLPTDCYAFYITAGSKSTGPASSSQTAQWMHDAMLVSIIRGIPTLNGRSGKTPPGWALRDITAPNYEARVRGWIRRHRLKGKVCQLPLDS